jgi:NarL family two-component system response regulator LiaR
MVSTRKIRVMIVDEHEMVALGLSIVFDDLSDMEMVGRAENGAAAIQLAGELRPDVIVMDIMMPVMDGLTATRIIHERDPHIRIIILSASTLDADREAALGAGAQGYVTKEGSSAELVETIRACMH